MMQPNETEGDDLGEEGSEDDDAMNEDGFLKNMSDEKFEELKK